MNRLVFWKTMENVRKSKCIELVTTKRRKRYLVSEPNYYITKYNWYNLKNLLAMEMNQTKVAIDKPVYSGLSIVDISKIAMHEYWYNYAKPKCRDSVKLSYMDANSLHNIGRSLCRHWKRLDKIRYFKLLSWSWKTTTTLRENQESAWTGLLLYSITLSQRKQFVLFQLGFKKTNLRVNQPLSIGHEI